MAYLRRGGLGKGDAKTCSGSSTSPSSLRKRIASSSVLPEPAGACTRMEQLVSRASSRAAPSANFETSDSTIRGFLCRRAGTVVIVFRFDRNVGLGNSAEPGKRAIPAGLRIGFWLDRCVTGEKIDGKIAQRG